MKSIKEKCNSKARCMEGTVKQSSCVEFYCNIVEVKAGRVLRI